VSKISVGWIYCALFSHISVYTFNLNCFTHFMIFFLSPSLDLVLDAGFCLLPFIFQYQFHVVTSLFILVPLSSLAQSLSR
jgi:hypothetical protein